MIDTYFKSFFCQVFLFLTLAGSGYCCASDNELTHITEKRTWADGVDYNVTLLTPNYRLIPMDSERDYQALQTLCTKEGFSYPYIHFHQKTQHLPIEERILAYAKLGDSAASGELDRTLINSIYPYRSDELLGAAILIAIEPDSSLFVTANSETEWEIGYFVDRDHWGQHIATEAIRAAIQYGISNWGLKGLWASVEPNRESSESILRDLGLKLAEEIPAGSERIPYLDEKNQPAPRHIYHTPEGWNLPEMKFD